MKNPRYFLLGGVLIAILLVLVLVFYPPEKAILDNNVNKAKITSSLPDECYSELRLNEKDASGILAFILTSNEDKLPQGISIKDCGLSLENSMIGINVELEKKSPLLELPINLHLELSPSTKNNIIYLDVNKAYIAEPVSPSLAVKLLASSITPPSQISFNESQIIIDLRDYPLEISNIGFDNELIILQFKLLER